MAEGDTARLLAWKDEIRRVHARLREALAVVRSAVVDGRDVPGPERELLLYCHGFCVALDGHHAGEDAVLFPAIAQAHPTASAVLATLSRDHGMIAELLCGLREASEGGRPAVEVARHLDGVEAIMESHFRYEERALAAVLERLDLDVPPESALGPLAQQASGRDES